MAIPDMVWKYLDFLFNPFFLKQVFEVDDKTWLSLSVQVAHFKYIVVQVMVDL